MESFCKNCGYHELDSSRRCMACGAFNPIKENELQKRVDVENETLDKHQEDEEQDLIK